MREIICSMPGCQTTAGCQCNRLAVPAPSKDVATRETMIREIVLQEAIIAVRKSPLGAATQECAVRAIQAIMTGPPATVSGGGVRYEYDPIAGKMRYFGSAAPNGWIGDDGEKTDPDDWFSQVVSFFVKHDMLDARDEYDIGDVMAALEDNYAPALINAVQGIDADYMTSENHHPGYVLIPTAKFEEIRSALVAAVSKASE